MDHADFGRYLSQQRQLRGLTREDVARATRIPSTIIHALESGEVDRLPARVFVLNYIRAYAQVIGLAPDDAILRFEEIDKTAHGAPPPAALEWERKKRALVTLAGVVLAITVAACGLLLASGHLKLPWSP